MAIGDIQDEGSFREWLEETNQPQQICVALAHRAGMRVLPLFWSYAAKNRPSMALPILRAQLVAGIAGGAPAALLIREGLASALRDAAWAARAARDAVAAGDAAWAAWDAARAAGNAAWAAAWAATWDAARVASSADWAAWDAAWDAARAALRSDCAAVERGETLAALPLFPDVLPDWFTKAADEMHAGPEWRFWLKWYADARQGRQQNWPLLFEIATQPEEFWQGADPDGESQDHVVNRRIAVLAARHEAADC